MNARDTLPSQNSPRNGYGCRSSDRTLRLENLQEGKKFQNVKALRIENKNLKCSNRTFYWQARLVDLCRTLETNSFDVVNMYY